MHALRVYSYGTPSKDSLQPAIVLLSGQDRPQVNVHLEKGYYFVEIVSLFIFIKCKIIRKQKRAFCCTYSLVKYIFEEVYAMILTR